MKSSLPPKDRKALKEIAEGYAAGMEELFTLFNDPTDYDAVQIEEKPLPPALKKMAEQIAKRCEAKLYNDGPEDAIEQTETVIAPDLLGTGVYFQKAKPLSEQAQMENEVLKRELTKVVAETLSPREQAIIAMVCIDGRSHRYAAKQLNLMTGRVEGLKKNALVKLRHALTSKPRPWL